MAILGFTGQLPVAIGIVWKGDTVANTMTSALSNNSHLIANESVTELSVTALFGGTTRILERKATAKKRLYDDTLNLFVSEPVSSKIVEEFLTLNKGDKLFLELGFTFNTFFEKMLEQMTRTDADLHNLANPNDSAAILSTFKNTGGPGNVSVTYKSATQKAKGLQGKLIDKEVKAPSAGSKIPAVKLMIEINFGSTPSPLQKELMRKLIAMDWSKLARFGQPKTTRKDVEIWQQNVLLYLANHTDMGRAEAFRQAVIGRHQGKTPVQLSTDLRDDLDLQLITANHWGQAREDLKTETHQRLLSDLFGTLHQKTWLSSPVYMARRLGEMFLAGDFDKKAALALQYGTGHCGEHATCSFSVLRAIMQRPGNQVAAVVFSGNANIDHAFCVYNLVLDQTFFTIARSPANTRVKAGQPIQVFNLRDQITKNKSRRGFVMDPYLDKSVMKATAPELLTALNSAKRQAVKKDTDFLAFTAYHPPPDPPVNDITGNSAAQQAAQIKNV